MACEHGAQRPKATKLRVVCIIENFSPSSRDARSLLSTPSVVNTCKKKARIHVLKAARAPIALPVLCRASTASQTKRHPLHTPLRRRLHLATVDWTQISQNFYQIAANDASDKI